MPRKAGQTWNVAWKDKYTLCYGVDPLYKNDADDGTQIIVGGECLFCRHVGRVRNEKVNASHVDHKRSDDVCESPSLLKRKVPALTKNIRSYKNCNTDLFLKHLLRQHKDQWLTYQGLPTAQRSSYFENAAAAATAAASNTVPIVPASTAVDSSGIVSFQQFVRPQPPPPPPLSSLITSPSPSPSDTHSHGYTTSIPPEIMTHLHLGLGSPSQVHTLSVPVATTSAASLTSIPFGKQQKAIICYGPKDYRFDSILVPTPGPGEVLVRVTSVGIGYDDMKCFEGSKAFWGGDNRPPYCQIPVVPGHGSIGDVVALGEGAAEKHSVNIGDQAISEQIVPCWKCRYCLRGSYHMCQMHDLYGFHQDTPGAMCEYMLYKERSIVHKVPRTIGPTEAVYIEPLACAVHAVERADILFDDVVVIAGAGSLGLGIITAAKLKHPKLLIVLDNYEWKLKIAKKCGADIVFQPDVCNVAEEIKRLTDGYGCDVYIEATGNRHYVKQGMFACAKQARFIEFSVFSRETSIDWTIIDDMKELDIRGSHLGPHSYAQAIRMLEQRLLPINDIITHKLPMTDFKVGMDLVSNGNQSIKVCLLPWQNESH